MRNSPFVIKTVLQCLLYLTISTMAICQQSFPYVHKGWKADVQTGDTYVLKTNAKNAAELDYGSIDKSQKNESRASLHNSFSFDTPIPRGAVLVEGEFKTDSLTDVNEAGFVISGSMDNKSPYVFFRNLASSRVKNHNVVNKIYWVIPFETPINTLGCSVHIKGAGKVQISHLKVTVTKGEFDDTWKTAYADRVAKDKTLRDKLALYIKVWGFLKYYAAAISEKNIDWDAAFVKYLPAVFSADKKADFNQSLNNLIATSQTVIAKSNFRIDSFSKVQLINFDNSWLTKSELLDNDISIHLRKIEKGYQPFRNYYVQLADGVTIPSPKFNHEEAYTMYTLPDVRYRLLLLARYWNIIQYYYPYKYAIGENWEKILEKNIPLFTAATTGDAYMRAALLLDAAINDGHALISPVTTKLSFWRAVYGTDKTVIMPLLFEIIDSNEVVVSKVDSSFSARTGIKAGHRMLAINNESMSDRVAAIAQYISASRREMKYYYISALHLLSNVPLASDSLTFKYSSESGELKSATANFASNYYKDYPDPAIFRHIANGMGAMEDNTAKKAAIKLLKDSILYVDVSLYTQKDSTQLIQLLPVVKKAMIDLRKYPSPDAYSMVPFFAPVNTPYITGTYPSAYPAILEKLETGSTYHTTPPLFKGKLALLISEGTQSKGEFYTMMLQTVPHVKLIGRTTAGADGEKSYIPGVGVYGFAFSGMRVIYPDNKETQRVGIKPDVYVPMTVKEASTDSDMIQDAAIRYLEQ